MNYETIDLRTDGAVGVLTLNRPERLNSLNKTLLGELLQALDAVNNDKSLKALVLTGAGRVRVWALGLIRYFSCLKVCRKRAGAFPPARASPPAGHR